MKSKRIAGLRIFKERDRWEKIIIFVYVDYIPVARFNQDDINERKLAAIELVERGHCNQTIAGKTRRKTDPNNSSEIYLRTSPCGSGQPRA